MAVSPGVEGSAADSVAEGPGEASILGLPGLLFDS